MGRSIDTCSVVKLGKHIQWYKIDESIREFDSYRPLTNFEVTSNTRIIGNAGLASGIYPPLFYFEVGFEKSFLSFPIVYFNMTGKILSAKMSFLPFDIFNEVKKLFLRQSLKWCNSYNSIVVTMWVWVILFFYVIFLIILKLFYKLYVSTSIVEKLCNSIENGDIVKCVKLLEKYPKYINVYNRMGYTPFLIACANGQTQILKLMLKKGADVKRKSKQFESAFYLSTFYYIRNPHIKNATCIRELYYAGANIDEPNAKGLTPLQMASMFGHTPLVRWLLLKNASVVSAPDPYILALSQGYQETAKVILDHTHGLAIDFK